MKKRGMWCAFFQCGLLSLLLFPVICGAQTNAAAAKKSFESMQPAELQTLIADNQKACEQTLNQAQEMKGKVSELRLTARRSDPGVQVQQQQIDDLYRAIEKTIDAVPAVKTATDGLNQTQRKLFELMQEQTRLKNALFAAQERETAKKLQAERKKEREANQ